MKTKYKLYGYVEQGYCIIPIFENNNSYFFQDVDMNCEKITSFTLIVGYDLGCVIPLNNDISKEIGDECIYIFNIKNTFIVNTRNVLYYIFKELINNHTINDKNYIEYILHDFYHDFDVSKAVALNEETTQIINKLKNENK